MGERTQSRATDSKTRTKDDQGWLCNRLQSNYALSPIHRCNYTPWQTNSAEWWKQNWLSSDKLSTNILCLISCTAPSLLATAANANGRQLSPLKGKFSRLWCLANIQPQQVCCVLVTTCCPVYTKQKRQKRKTVTTCGTPPLSNSTILWFEAFSFC